MRLSITEGNHGRGSEMEMWTRNNSQVDWHECRDIMSGIAGLQSAGEVEILFVSECPLHELEQLLNEINIVRRIFGKSATVIVASPHPSRRWISSVKNADIDQIWEVSAHHEKYRKNLPDHTEQFANTACPALHIREEGGSTLSVCGCHHDRMILAHHHLQRWCLKNKDECPHWKENGWKASVWDDPELKTKN